MTTVLVDKRISAACERRLEIFGYSVIKLPPSPGLPEAIASHPDSLIFKLGDSLVTSADFCDVAPYVFSELRERHPELKIYFSSDTFGQKYPDDCKMNALVMGDKIFARAASLSGKIKELASLSGYEIIDTKQGYPACTTLKISESHAVTADLGMTKILKKCKVKVTNIGNFDISLPPYDYGFIGGACGVHNGSVYFFGSLDTHREAAKIRAAIEEAGLRAVSLSDEPLADLGGMVFI